MKNKYSNTTLNFLIESEYFSFLDLSLSEELIKLFSLPEIHAEPLIALICYLSLAMRHGHLCITVDDQELKPDPWTLWEENSASKAPLTSSEEQLHWKTLINLISIGKQLLPEKFLTKIKTDNFDPHQVQTPLCVMDQRIYFQRLWFYETTFLHYYQEFIKHSPALVINKTNVENTLEKLIETKKILPEQATAILGSCEHSLTIICGGPGTGKTYTAGMLVRILWESLNENDRQNFKISLAAPTGKAAANLQKSLLNASDHTLLSGLKAKTLHSLLDLKATGIPVETQPLSFDLILIDESSMIDVRLMAVLFKSLKPGSRIILLGDPYQLPAVESGSIFADLIVGAKTDQSKVNLVELKRCLRVELQGILQTAAAIHAGNAGETLKIFQEDNQIEGIHRLKIDEQHSTAKITKEICTKALEFYQWKDFRSMQPEQILQHFNRFRLLTPLRKGPFGVEELNRQISDELKTFLLKKSDPYFAVPILLLKNDPRQELFNGEVGVLIKPQFKEQEGSLMASEGDYAFFMDKDNGIKKIPALLLPPYEYAFCLSVHKSQGSEFEHLLLLLPPGSERFGRELLYTAVTRAKRQLTLWSNDKTLEATIERQNQRLSGVSSRL